MSDLRDSSGDLRDSSGDMRDPAGGMRDPAAAAIEAQYRAASTEQPGAAADAAILALARTAAALNQAALSASTAAAESAPASTVAATSAADATGTQRIAANDASWTRRWRAPLALAAGVVLSVGIVTRIQLEPPESASAPSPRRIRVMWREIPSPPASAYGDEYRCYWPISTSSHPAGKNLWISAGASLARSRG